jgi:NADH-quinone oxidoreductase subunit H
MNSSPQDIFGFLQTWRVELVCAVVIMIAVPLAAGYSILLKRKLLPSLLSHFDAIHPRPRDLFQVISNAFALLMRRDAAPAGADQFIFWLAPIVSMAAAFISLSALYVGPAFRVVRDINIGILFILGVGSLGFLGILLNSGVSSTAIRSTAQFVSYGLAASLAIVSALLLCGTLNIHAIVDAQSDQRVWYIFLAPFGFFIYLVASIYGINRRPFQSPESAPESAGVSASEYAGFRSSLFFLGEYATMIAVASVATTLFFGGWLRPFPNVHWLNWLDYSPALLIAAIGAYYIYRAGKQPIKIQTWFARIVALGCFVLALILLLPWVLAPARFAVPSLNGAFWFLLKVSIYLSIFVWLRSTLPQWRFDQLLHLGWYILIPLAMTSIFFIAIALLFESEFNWNRWLVLTFANILTAAAGVCLVHLNDKRPSSSHSAPVLTPDSYGG